MFDLLKPVLWVALLVLVALAAALLLEPGGTCCNAGRGALRRFL